MRHAVGVAASVADRAGQLRRVELPDLLFTDDVYTLMNACDAVVTKSGTITLEATIFERPMVIMYSAAWLGKVE